MKKEKVVYRFNRYVGKTLHVKKEISFEIRLGSRLLLDELCFNLNQAQLEKQLNAALENGDAAMFRQISEAYKQYVWEGTQQ
ncbi:hypothetical protein P5G51_013485 [Virgibacillus sp. 179-BFC.A HS]|uniref:IDEAL domain-containing protein n=1 Tax=Tigheibacillus jepli TaxID=3035914 RepID=A0ABU5CL91_9BACI|nr:hypothetical protein [Virgibacillus sp. 179-BFC.A HS]MDY0406268.1 hypothetical protein [Virgibacillus sp. 179-BFC.A HS]